MKELLAGFAAEIFRPIVTLLIPGFWVLTPWAIFTFLRHPTAWQFVIDHNDGAGLAFVVASTAVGFVLEDIGARIEALFSSWRGHSTESWYKYLQTKGDAECIGTRYISSLALRLKFEQGMAAAGPFTFVGVLRLPIDVTLKAWLIGVVIAVTAYLLFEASGSVRTLEDARKHLF